MSACHPLPVSLTEAFALSVAGRVLTGPLRASPGTAQADGNSPPKDRVALLTEPDTPGTVTFIPSDLIQE